MAPRSPSRSSDGAHSEQHARAEPRLLKAIEDARNEDAVAILQEARAKPQPGGHLLRIGLMRAAERGNSFMTEYLLRNGAPPDGALGGRVSPLLRAIDKNYVGIVQLLLKFGGNKDVADKQGRTALMTAAWRNYWHILNELLRCNADVNKKDNQGRNVLHNLAADKHCNWGRDVIATLLRTSIALDGPDGQDETQRTPLHWAASTGKKELCEMLLTRPKGPKANINAVEFRDKSALHLAVAHGRDDIVELLLHYKADIRAESDGGWTALHYACRQGSVRIVQMLLEEEARRVHTAGGMLNAKLLNGMTPLHIAAQEGNVDVVKHLLRRKDIKRTARDTFGITPFLRAAQNKHKEIVNILAPSNNVDTLSKDALGACKGFNATIVDFGNFHNNNKVTKRTVYELLYGRDSTNNRKPAISILPKDSKATDFRWVHLPANNMAWVEALLTKAFIEEGANDVEGFKALERSFGHQHRGQQVHSHFMRPLCQITPRAAKTLDESDLSDSAEHGAPRINVTNADALGIIAASAHEGPSSPLPKGPPVRSGTMSTDQTDWTTGSVSGKDRKEFGKTREKTKKTPKWGGSRQAGGRSGNHTPDHHARRKSSMPLTSSGHLRSPGSPGRKESTQTAKGNIFTFMPYLHFETNTKRREMQAAIKRAQHMKELQKREGGSIRVGLKRASTYDEMLLRAHLSPSSVSLHVRRTLDQFFYHNIDTESRDTDQVVYRYQCNGMTPEESGVDPKIFMVDQLWMWVLGKDIIVTAFPQRWQQPKNDPLNVLDGIIEDINSKTHDRVHSVYDLAMMITGRCSGLFDRHRMGDETYQFMDMFESTIGNATDQESILFKEFDIASKKASAWLQHHRRSNRFSRHLEAEGRNLAHQNRRIAHSHTHALADPPIDEEHFPFEDNEPAHAPLFVDNLLDIGKETKLLAEIKDIRDELNMIHKVLEDQKSVLPGLQDSIKAIYLEEHKRQKDVTHRFTEQLKTIDMHIKDLARMDKQAERIYKSITDLLDLKQKHANAFEARFARDQAAGTARQSQTIMVFTIVTIIFLPLSFISSFFAINIEEFPHRPGGEEPSLPIAWVSQYMFGIGLAFSIPFIAIALSFDTISDFFREKKLRFTEWSRRKKSKHNELENDKAIDYMHSFEHIMSAGRSVADTRGRPSVESYLGGAGLFPVTSRTTARSEAKNDLHIINGNGGSRRGSTAARPPHIKKVSTGFKMRNSEDVDNAV